MTVDFKKLTSFVKIVDAGSMSRAAHALNIAQPALSQHVAAYVTSLKARPMSSKTVDFDDPITLQVLWNRLVFIADQADRALGRTAFSPIVRENHDYVTVLMDAKGRALSQCTWAIPVFITSLPMAVQHYFLPAFPPETLEPGDDKRLVVAMIETVEALGNLDAILAVEGIDVFFVGPGDLSQSMGFMPSVPRGQSRPREVLDAVEKTLAHIRKAGKIAGTLVIEEDIAHWSKHGAQLLYCHIDPFLRDKIEAMHKHARV